MGIEETSNRGKVKVISGLYAHSSKDRTSIRNRDINAAVNMVQIISSLINFEEMPREFRPDVFLREKPGYTSLAYSYRAKPGWTNEHGQIMKFERIGPKKATTKKRKR